MNYLNSLYQQVLLSISIILPDCEKQVKAGRPPKVSDLQIACLYVMSYVTNTPVLNLAKILIDPSIQSYHYSKGCKHIQGTDKEDKESCRKEILGKKEKKHLQLGLPKECKI
jgi:hypothetical protein